MVEQPWISCLAFLKKNTYDIYKCSHNRLLTIEKHIIKIPQHLKFILMFRTNVTEEAENGFLSECYNMSFFSAASHFFYPLFFSRKKRTFESVPESVITRRVEKICDYRVDK